MKLETANKAQARLIDEKVKALQKKEAEVSDHRHQAEKLVYDVQALKDTLEIKEAEASKYKIQAEKSDKTVQRLRHAIMTKDVEASDYRIQAEEKAGSLGKEVRLLKSDRKNRDTGSRD